MTQKALKAERVEFVICVADYVDIYRVFKNGFNNRIVYMIWDLDDDD